MVGIGDIKFDRKPGTARLSNRMNSILFTIRECIKNRGLFPALILIYASMDILGSLQTKDGFANRESFKTWVREHILNKKSFDFDEEDLYSARCGILHTMRYESKINNTKTIVYGFYGDDAEIRKIINSTKESGVYVEELFCALVEGYKEYLEVLEKSTDKQINDNLNSLPAYIDLLPWACRNEDQTN